MKAESLLKNEDGSIIILAMIMLVLLTLLGVAATTTSTIEVRVADNEKSHKIAFYAADAGIEAGRAVLNILKTNDIGNWDNLLQGIQLVGQSEGVADLDAVIDADGGRNVGPATFNLAVGDNNDLDGNSQVDTDNIIILTSTGSYENAQAQVRAYVRYSGAGEQYAQEQYDTAGIGVVEGEDSGVAREKRW
jgi:hypothetical protein